MDDVTGRFERLEDEAAIVRLKARYARACDAGYDAAAIAELFVADGVWDGGDLFGRAEGRDAIRDHFAGASERITWALHFTLNPLIEVAADGRSATGSWYLWQPCTRRRAGGDQGAWLAGTYDDTYLRTDDGWRFATVTVRARWLEGPPELAR
jgi:ketosteroid isomerase-like protein